MRRRPVAWATTLVGAVCAAGPLRAASAAGLVRAACAAGPLRAASAADPVRAACASDLVRAASAAGLVRAASAAGPVPAAAGWRARSGRRPSRAWAPRAAGGDGAGRSRCSSRAGSWGKRARRHARRSVFDLGAVGSRPPLVHLPLGAGRRGGRKRRPVCGDCRFTV